MKDFVNINGDGDFVLRVNGRIAQTKSFSPEEKSAIIFDLGEYIASNSNDTFAPGSDVTFTLSIENFVNTNETLEEDFKLSFSMQADYHNTRPPTTDALLEFEVGLDSNDVLGDTNSTGSVFAYDLTLRNSRLTKGLLMPVAIFRIPSCLDINYNLLD
jgi:hypothetical protein